MGGCSGRTGCAGAGRFVDLGDPGRSVVIPRDLKQRVDLTGAWWRMLARWVQGAYSAFDDRQRRDYSV